MLVPCDTSSQRTNKLHIDPFSFWSSFLRITESHHPGYKRPVKVTLFFFLLWGWLRIGTGCHQGCAVSPSLLIFKPICTQTSATGSRWGGSDELQRSLPTSTALWFCVWFYQTSCSSSVRDSRLPTTTCSCIFSTFKEILNLSGQHLPMPDLSHSEELLSWNALECHYF